MPVIRFVRVPSSANANSANVAVTRQINPKLYFRPNLNFYARASNQPARFSPQHVVQARYNMYMTLMAMQRQQAAVAQMQAIHFLLLAYAGLRSGSAPAAAPQSPAVAHSEPARSEPARPASTRSGTAASGNASSTSYRSSYRSSRTDDSTSTPRSRPKAESSSSRSKAHNAGQRSSAEDAKRASDEMPSQAAAPSYSVSDAFKAMGLPETATPAEAKQAYYKAAREHHPDKGGDAEKFKVLNNAYETVKLHFEKAGS